MELEETSKHGECTMKRKSKKIVVQHTDVIISKDKEHSYWNSVMYGPDNKSSDNKLGETTLANPDSLIDEPENRLWGDGLAPEIAGRIIEEFTDGKGNFPLLSELENHVLRVYVVTGDVKEVQRQLKLTKGSVVKLMARIRSKMLRLIASRDF